VVRSRSKVDRLCASRWRVQVRASFQAAAENPHASLARRSSANHPTKGLAGGRIHHQRRVSPAVMRCSDSRPAEQEFHEATSPRAAALGAARLPGRRSLCARHDPILRRGPAGDEQPSSQPLWQAVCKWFPRFHPRHSRRLAIQQLAHDCEPRLFWLARPRTPSARRARGLPVAVLIRSRLFAGERTSSASLRRQPCKGSAEIARVRMQRTIRHDAPQRSIARRMVWKEAAHDEFSGMRAQSRPRGKPCSDTLVSAVAVRLFPLSGPVRPMSIARAAQPRRIPAIVRRW